MGAGSLRADGRKLNDVHLFQVKSPAESKEPWDFYNLVTTTPANQAFKPLAESNRGKLSFT